MLAESDVLSGNSLANAKQILSSLRSSPEIMSGGLSATDLIVAAWRTCKLFVNSQRMALIPDTNSH